MRKMDDWKYNYGAPLTLEERVELALKDIESENNRLRAKGIIPPDERQKGAGGDFDESEHPRDEKGMFSEKSRSTAPKGDESKGAAPIKTDVRLNYVMSKYKHERVVKSIEGVNTSTTTHKEWFVFDVKGVNVSVPSDDVPSGLSEKFERLEKAFDLSNLPSKEHPAIVFYGRETQRKFSYKARDGKEYDTEAVAEAVYNENRIGIYDDFNPDDSIDHEVGHFEQQKMMFKTSYPKESEQIKGIVHVDKLEDYKNMLQILEDHDVLKEEDINKMLADDEYAVKLGVWDAMRENGLEYYANGYGAMVALRDRKRAGLPITLTPEIEKEWRRYKTEFKQNLKSNDLHTEWEAIYEKEPHTDRYSGRNQSETFAESYANMKHIIDNRIIEEKTVDGMSPEVKKVYLEEGYEMLHPDSTEWAKANPLKYAFMKKNVFKKFMPKNDRRP